MASATPFDPYHIWLGIAPKDQPPHHYRLLAIDLFESNADVIALAADQRMAHLRTITAGPNVALSQRLLNEVAAARICLLTPQKKAQYDARSRAVLTPASPLPATPPGNYGTPSIPQPAPGIPIAPSHAPFSVNSIGLSALQEIAAGDIASPPSPRRNRGPRGKRPAPRGPGAYTLVVLAAGIIGLAGILWVRANRWQIQLVEAEPKAVAKQAAKARTPAKTKMETTGRLPEKQAKPLDDGGPNGRVTPQKPEIRQRGKRDDPGASQPPANPASPMDEPARTAPPTPANDAGSSTVAKTSPAAEQPTEPPATVEKPEPAGAIAPNDSRPIPEVDLIRLVEQAPRSTTVGAGYFAVNKLGFAPQESDSEAVTPLITPEFHVCQDFYGAHAPSSLRCPIPRGAKSFTVVGYNHASKTVSFAANVDGINVYTSGVGSLAPIKIDLRPGASLLELAVDSAGDKDFDHSYWCYPRFHAVPVARVTDKMLDGQPGPLRFSVASHSVGAGSLTRNTPLDGTNSAPVSFRDAIPCQEFIYAHARSSVTYDVPGGMTRFTAIGYCTRSQSVRYLVIVDGRLRYQSPVAGIVAIDVQLGNESKQIVLHVDDAGDNHSDWSMWCYPRLHRK